MPPGTHQPCPLPLPTILQPKVDGRESERPPALLRAVAHFPRTRFPLGHRVQAQPLHPPGNEGGRGPVGRTGALVENSFFTVEN